MKSDNFAKSFLTIVRIAIVLLMFANVEPAIAGSVDLAWDPHPDSRVVGYNVYRWEPNTWSAIGSISLETSFRDWNAIEGATYYYAVTAVDYTGVESNFSNVIQATVAFYPPPSFENLFPVEPPIDPPPTFNEGDVLPIPPPYNNPPGLVAGNDQTVLLSESAIVWAVVNDDGLPSGQLTYLWSVVEGYGVSINAPYSDATHVFFSHAGPHLLRVTVSDGEFWVSDDVYVEVREEVAEFLTVASEAASVSSLGLSLIRYEYNTSPVSDAVFQSVPPVNNGQIYALVQESQNTGISIHNPNSETVVIDFRISDATGSPLHTGQLSLPPGDQITSFLNESPLSPGSAIDMSKVRSFSFSASAPVAAAAVRTMTNERGDLLMTALPIAGLNPAGNPLTLPFYANGGGWQSEIQLVNPTDSNVYGTVQVFPKSEGADSDFVYQIPPRSALAVKTDGLGSEPRTGWVQVTPMDETPSPAGSLMLLQRTNGVTTSIGTVYSTAPASPYHLYAETSGGHGEPGTVQTTISVANPASTAAGVNFELLTMDWQPTGLRGAMTIAAHDRALFNLDQTPGMAAINGPFTGIIRITGDPVSAAGFLSRYNERGEFVLTALPAVSNSMGPSASEPRYLFRAEGGGFSTKLTDVDSLEVTGGR